MLSLVPCLLVAFCLCSTSASAQSSRLQPEAGDPAPGLTTEQLVRFLRGRNAYVTPIEVEQGLGPIFNKASCSGCHDSPTGGAGTVTVVNFGFAQGQEFDPRTERGGPLLQVASIHADCTEVLPGGTNVIRPRLTLGTLGYGYIEAIPDEDLIAYAEASQIDGTSGRVHMVGTLAHQDDPDLPLRVGRFGWKGQIATVFDFSVDAAFNELGLTSPHFPEDNVANDVPGSADSCDTVPDPELPDPDVEPDSFLGHVIDFQRFMAVPPQTPPSGMTGELLFEQIGCAVCHKPSWVTSDDPELEEFLRGKEIRPYSNFLIHDMGTALRDRIIQGDATGNEFRTPALWNLRARPRLLHDGRAASPDFEERVREAIAEHGRSGNNAEPDNAHDRFVDLDAAEQDQVIAFLGSLGRREFDMDADGDLDGEDLFLAMECLGRSVTPDDECAVADIDLDGEIDFDDIQVLREILGLVEDCNGNGIEDDVDIAAGMSDDADEDGLPDECLDIDCGERIIRLAGSGGTIPDGFGMFSDTINVDADLGEILDIRVRLQGIQHDWAEELVITLTHLVDGVQVDEVISDFCGISWNWAGTYMFRDDAVEEFCPVAPVDNDLNLLEDDYLPLNPIRPTFVGRDGSGSWTLTIVDQASLNAGTIDSWAVDLVVRTELLDCNNNGIEDTCEFDSDGDGIINDCDLCPNDPNRSFPGPCGCDSPAEVDSDGDGTPDCVDGCPDNPTKFQPGACGCAFNDIDSDADGVLDCFDECPFNDQKVEAGLCGCDFDDVDSDGDGTPDCDDLCPGFDDTIDSDFDTVPDLCDQCPGIEDVDSDGDGTADCVDGCPDNPDKIEPDGCGCEEGGEDFDADGTPDCIDGCPEDALKVEPGECGCGVADDDTDADGTADCIDECPDDPDKIQSGECGCGVPEGDSDGDGTSDCVDQCPDDAGKTEPGACGCGTSDDDSDGDGTLDCFDGCPGDPLKIAPGACGCGALDIDGDGDGVFDCDDGCPDDPLKSSPGVCGCGVPDDDSDGDGVFDCNDDCPDDPTRTVAGVCGCDEPDGDSDADGTPDCNDECPLDSDKILAGDCGCGVEDVDSDADGTADCIDACPDDAGKIEPGDCGCGNQDVDSDGDGTADCIDGCPGDIDKVEPGQCGCDVPDTDSDEDGTADCIDGCPEDIDKVDPGECGCGVPDTDSDADGTVDCADECPDDPAKTVAGSCGCGVSEDDSDGDGTPDCTDGCPDDATKLDPGVCGCGVPDDDSDGDGTLDCNDGCPDDVEKVEPGSCGCGVPDVDTDEDGTLDCFDSCPTDPEKTSPGTCGCGAPDDDSDGDGTADCLDACPNDPLKTVAGFCGCGIEETDGDLDGTPDCADGCPEDPLKTAPGQCGCGEVEEDLDGDGTADCMDQCPEDPEKTAPGICGCGVPEDDSDGDGTYDCYDLCPVDENKIYPGLCGCGVSDDDGDDDGTPDCFDGCPEDADKLEPGECGCGVADDDSDGDGTLDCFDGCPDDAGKTEPGDCGCGLPDDDSDGDGTLDCFDGCPDDANKIEEGVCGCGVADDDSDADGSFDCDDGCPDDPGKTEAGQCGCGVEDADADGDGTADCIDACPEDANKIEEGACGCGVEDVDGDADGTFDCNDGCPDDAGKIDPGTCGCGIPDEDSDGNGLVDCEETGPISWTVSEGGNGHLYDLVEVMGGSSWQDAAELARAAGGTLVTITSQGEADFLQQRVLDYLPPMDAAIRPPWIGGFQDTGAPGYSEPAGGWVWVTGEPFERLDWVDGDPDDADCDGLPEGSADHLALSGDGTGFTVQWTDRADPASGQCEGQDWEVVGYLVEWSEDCTHDGIVDYRQILDGELADENGNGIPDVCEDTHLDVPLEYPTITSAIDVAGEGDVVLVGPGVYNEVVDFQGKPIEVRASGTDPAETVLDGTGLLSSIIVMTNQETSTSVLEGFTIRNGTSGSSYPLNPTKMVGGGVFLFEASPTVRNCVFLDNAAVDGGGAFLYLSSAIFEGCVFRGNQADGGGGAMQMHHSTTTVDGCTFHLNSAQGWAGAIQVNAGAPTIDDSVFLGNSAGDEGGAMVIAVDFALGGDVPITNCVFSSNQAVVDAGGILVLGDLHDVRLLDSSLCENAPNHIVGPWIDEGGNAFCECPGDLNADGIVQGEDLTMLLGAWGVCAPECPSDLDWDGLVDGSDLTILLANWGLCEE